MKANMSVFLGYLGMIDEGAALARKIRQWGQFEEERMKREREAETTGKQVVRSGQFWLR